MRTHVQHARAQLIYLKLEDMKSITDDIFLNLALHFLVSLSRYSTEYHISPSLSMTELTSIRG